MNDIVYLIVSTYAMVRGILVYLFQDCTLRCSTYKADPSCRRPQVVRTTLEEKEGCALD